MGTTIGAAGGRHDGTAVRSRLEDGEEAVRRYGWRVISEPGARAHPGSRRAERAALEAGSVAGRSFSAALVAAALDADVVEIEGCLAALAHAGLMVGADGSSAWPDGTVAGRYRFDQRFIVASSE